MEAPKLKAQRLAWVQYRSVNRQRSGCHRSAPLPSPPAEQARQKQTRNPRTSDRTGNGGSSGGDIDLAGTVEVVKGAHVETIHVPGIKSESDGPLCIEQATSV